MYPGPNYIVEADYSGNISNVRSNRPGHDPNMDMLAIQMDMMRRGETHYRSNDGNLEIWFPKGGSNPWGERQRAEEREEQRNEREEERYRHREQRRADEAYERRRTEEYERRHYADMERQRYESDMRRQMTYEHQERRRYEDGMRQQRQDAARQRRYEEQQMRRREVAQRRRREEERRRREEFSNIRGLPAPPLDAITGALVRAPRYEPDSENDGPESIFAGYIH